MRLSTLLLFICFVLSIRLLGQTSTSDCEGAIILCGGIYSEDSAPPGTGNVYEYTGACNNSLETMSLWYTFTVQQDGDLSFVLTPNTVTDDYDWGMFEITNGGCAGIVSQDGSSPEVSCNSYGTFGDNGPTGISTANGGTGNTNGPGDLNGPQYNADIPVTTGQTFALVVMNWSNSLSGYTIDFTGSTATLYDNINPTVTEFEHNCGNTEFHITFSELIDMSTVEALDFTISGPDGTIWDISQVTPDQPGVNLEDGFTLSLNDVLPTGGVYTVNITNTSGNVADPCGNLAVDASFEIVVPDPITFDITSTYACNGSGGSIALSNIAGGIPPLTATIDGIPAPEFNAQNLNGGNHTVVFSDQSGCTTAETILVPNQDLSLTIPATDSLSCSNALVTIDSIQIVPNVDVNYSWSYQEDDGTWTNFPSSTNEATVAIAGLYQLLITEPISGCSQSSSVEVGESNSGFIDLTNIAFPNVLSADKDGKNDTWRPFLSNDPNLNLASVFDEYELMIFDRWGVVVFNSGDGNGRIWSPRESSPGVYYYVLHYSLTCGGVQEGRKEGWIQVF